jgi:Abi-like protein
MIAAIHQPAVAEGLSSARLTRYVESTDTLEAALALYEWNTQIAAALFELLQHAEVILRNALSKELTVLRIAHGDPAGHWFWFETDEWFAPWWQPEMLRQLKKVHGSLARTKRPITQGRIVAEVSFGFWRYLLTSHYESSLWTPALRRAFPRGLAREAVHDLVEHLNVLRNRIAHHEAVYNRNLPTDVLRIEQLLDWLSPPTADWAMTTSRLTKLWDQRPPHRTTGQSPTSRPASVPRSLADGGVVSRAGASSGAPWRPSGTTLPIEG